MLDRRYSDVEMLERWKTGEPDNQETGKPERSGQAEEAVRAGGKINHFEDGVHV